VEAVSLSALISATIKRYLKWYLVPFIYFLLTGLLCAYAWYTRPLPYRAGIKAVYKIISLNPTLIFTGAITAWIIIAILFIPISFWLRKRLPELSIWSFSQKEDILQNKSSNKTPKSFWQKTLNVALSVVGIILIVAGLSIAAWISRPYITFLFSPSKIETLEKKAGLLGQVQVDKIKKINASDTPKKLPERVKKDEIKKSVALTTRAELPEQLRKDETNKNGPFDKIADLFERVRRESLKRTTEIQTRGENTARTLEKNAEFPGQVQEDWIIIPTALVDAPLLEGLSEKNLSLGVCHVSNSAVPGKGGNCIIEGHNLGNFGMWRPQGPFNMLEVLEKGVRIYVFYNGKKYTYKVKEQTYRNADDPKLYDLSLGERLTLITCTTTWDPTIDTDKRTVIVAYPE
jgi:LPXTG-site transpeptidase (sortase) family protein